jgi:hypothetical protein
LAAGFQPLFSLTCSQASWAKSVQLYIFW